ncbi:GH25 family lysozyme M1 (1,4-beta-N-acetylmuramidase) [Haloferula luteola]|uniref:GH25 family lysozyme M1 (1,4-beta-N-acetylmuramidase) n=1 Tax=Haloferula luteola TaxID=595692 RepID=A0A840V8S3_9BACT|nr:glycoside hydrolase family 25 protein [Haloferula luteola]MBB5350179.1 GH25 family lysozyme M1 (1,4-beta-N-acetylmuramidase) [Haloferula luteola]
MTRDTEDNLSFPTFIGKRLDPESSQVATDVIPDTIPLQPRFDPAGIGGDRYLPTDPTSPLSVPSEPDGDPFNEPWTDSRTSIVIDAYQGNGIDWSQLLKDPRVAGVIHRATIGTQQDKKYSDRRAAAQKFGLLWGSYHLGKSGDPLAQAREYLDITSGEKNTMFALDLEDTGHHSMMNVDGAKRFVKFFYDQKGFLPVIYANQNVTRHLNQSLAGDAHFSQTRLWYARFKRKVSDFPKGLWTTYFLWQFSSEINCQQTGQCLYNVPGTRFDMDVNVYFGTPKELAKHWA